jgi:hypothetical protein
MTAAPLRYPAGDNAHRPFPHDLGRGMGGFMAYMGCGYRSHELGRLIADFGEGRVKAACDRMRCRPIRSNAERLRAALEGGE